MFPSKMTREVEAVLGVSPDKIARMSAEFSCDLTVLREDTVNEEELYSPAGLYDTYSALFRKLKIDEPPLQLLTMIGRKTSKMEVKSSSGINGTFTNFTIFTDDKVWVSVQFRQNDAKKAKSAAALLAIKNKFPFFFKFYVLKKSEHFEELAAKFTGNAPMVLEVSPPLPVEQKKPATLPNVPQVSQFTADPVSKGNGYLAHRLGGLPQTVPESAQKSPERFVQPAKPPTNGSGVHDGFKGMVMAAVEDGAFGNISAIQPVFQADFEVTNFVSNVNKNDFRERIPLENVRNWKNGFAELVDSLFRLVYSCQMTVVYTAIPGGWMGIKALIKNLPVFAAQVRGSSKLEAKEAVCRHFLVDIFPEINSTEPLVETLLPPTPTRSISNGSRPPQSARSGQTSPHVTTQLTVPAFWKEVERILECQVTGFSLAEEGASSETLVAWPRHLRMRFVSGSNVPVLYRVATPESLDLSFKANSTTNHQSFKAVLVANWGGTKKKVCVEITGGDIATAARLCELKLLEKTFPYEFREQVDTVLSEQTAEARLRYNIHAAGATLSQLNSSNFGLWDLKEHVSSVDANLLRLGNFENFLDALASASNTPIRLHVDETASNGSGPVFAVQVQRDPDSLFTCSVQCTHSSIARNIAAMYVLLEQFPFLVTHI